MCRIKTGGGCPYQEWSKFGSDQEGDNKWITQGSGGVTDVRGSDGGKKGSIVNKCGFLVPSHTQISYRGWLNCDISGSDGGKKGSIVNKCGFLVPSHTQLIIVDG